MRLTCLLLLLGVLGCGGGATSTTVAVKPPKPEPEKPLATQRIQPSQDRDPPRFGAGGGASTPPGNTKPTEPAKPRVDIVAELEKLPVGLEVIHTPDKVSDVEGPRTEPQGWPYHWKFKTEVRALEKPLTIILFGTLLPEGDRWVLPERLGQYEATLWAPKDFIDWYKCPGARVEPGKPVVDAENWSGARVATGFKQKWFFIARDDEGKRYKGEAVVELLPKP